MKTVIVEKSTNKILARFSGTVKLPSNWTDPNRVVRITVPEEMDLDCITYGVISEVAEYWSKEGESDVSEQPLLAAALWTKEGETPVTSDPQDETWTAHAIDDNDPTWAHTPTVPEYDDIYEDQELEDAKLAGERDAKLARLREIRKSDKFPEFDVLVTNYSLGDTTHTQQELVNHQTALKDLTDNYRVGTSGDNWFKGTASLDSVDTENFTWPTI